MAFKIVIKVIPEDLFIAHCTVSTTRWEDLLSGGMFSTIRVLNLLAPSGSSCAGTAVCPLPSAVGAVTINVPLGLFFLAASIVRASLRISRRRYASPPHVIQSSVNVQVMVTHQIKVAWIQSQCAPELSTREEIPARVIDDFFASGGA